MANKKISLQFDEQSLARWKAATTGMTNAQLSSYVKLAVGAENAAAKVVAAAKKANAKIVSDETKTNAKILADRQKSFDRKVQLYEKEDTKRRQIAAKTEQTEINANAKIESAQIKAANATKKHAEAEGELDAQASKTSKTFDSLTQRFTAANLISALIVTGVHKLRQAVREANEELKEMSKELTTIRMVTGASDSEISALTSQAFTGAKANGRNVTDYLTAAERFARAGYRENIDDLSKLSLITQNIGGVEEETAAKFLLAADAAWKLGGSYESLMGVLDGVSAVADQNATDLSKIAEGITVAGSAMANAGESAQTFTAMLGVTTASTQRSGSEMARGLRMILFRVRQVKAEFEDGEVVDAKAISNAANALKDIAQIDVIDKQTGDLKSMSQVLTELAPKWKHLKDWQQSMLQNYLAGNRNGNVLFALMDNWGTYEKMLQQYEDSAGTALEKNAKYTESWAAETDKLKTAWTETAAIMTNSGEIQRNIVSWTAEALSNINEFLRKQQEANAGYDRYAAARLILGNAGTEGFGGGGAGESFGEASPDRLKRKIESVTSAIKENKDTLVDHSEAVDTDTDAVNDLANAFDAAQEKIKAASDAMKTDRDSAVKSAADVYKAMTGAEKKGYYGSNAYREGANLFFGTSDKSQIKKSAKDALATYFDGIKDGDYSTAAATLWGKFADESGDIVDKESGNVIASMRDVGDAYEWAFNKGDQSMDDFLKSMSASTGLSETFWASMIESLGMYSEELADWTKENGELKTEAVFDSSAAESAISSYQGKLNSIPSHVVTTVETRYTATGGGGGGASSAAATWTGATKRAGGKHDRYSGIALVNDEYPADGSKPELIISNSTGRAYIANGGKPALVNLRSDDVVLTAKETKSALNVPGFWAGTISEGLGGTSGVTATTPKTTTTPKPKSSKSKASSVNATDSWNTLKKLVDYLLDKGEADLDDQLKVLDDQLDALEAARKELKESNELEERQLAVQNALLDLEKANVERTVRYYNENTQQWEWMADQNAVKSAQEAYDKALESLNEFLDEQEYNRQVDAIKAQKENLQAQFDAYEDAWKSIIDAIEAPSGDVKALLSLITKSGTSTMKEQSGGIADLLNSLRDGLVAAGYSFGLSNINANTSGSKTTASTVFDDGGFAIGSGFMRKGIGTETVIGPDITRAILDPVRNERFTSFVDSLKYLVDGTSPTFSGRSSVTNNNGGNYYVNGVRVGSDMAQRPFAEVMRTIAIHANETA